MKWTWVEWTWDEWFGNETGHSVPHLRLQPHDPKTACGIPIGDRPEEQKLFTPPSNACQKCRIIWRNKA